MILTRNEILKAVQAGDIDIDPFETVDVPASVVDHVSHPVTDLVM